MGEKLAIGSWAEFVERVQALATDHVPDGLVTTLVRVQIEPPMVVVGHQFEDVGPYGECSMIPCSEFAVEVLACYQWDSNFFYCDVGDVYTLAEGYEILAKEVQKGL